MLAFARKQPLQSRDLDLNEVVPRSVKLLERTLGEHIAVKTVLARDLWTAFADPSQLEDAILNLAVNARDAMPRRTMVIETANAILDEQYAAQNVEVTPGEYVSVFDHRIRRGCRLRRGARVRGSSPQKEVGHGTGLG